MGIPILRAKISAPELRQDHLFRPPLIQRLNIGSKKKLSTVIASAGYGKSSLLAEWSGALHKGVRFAWYSLDSTDQDPAIFFTYIIAALRDHWPGFGQSLESILNRPVPVSLEQTAIQFLSDLENATKDQTLVIIFDDYYKLGNLANIDVIFTYLLERLPKNVHLAISSRQSLSFSVARLRVDDQINEYAENELRFGSEEARLLFKQDNLPAIIQGLIERTEGWITGLQLIRQIFMQSQPNNLDRILSDSNDWMRGVFDYLANEIFVKLPSPLQYFLIQSSILDTLIPADCDLIFERGDSAEWLSYLVSNGLYTVLLGRNPETYRYHQLWIEFLGQKLSLDDKPKQIRNWHIRAAEHYRAKQQWNDAFKHAIHADKSLAAEIYLQVAPMMRLNGQISTLQSWLDQFQMDDFLTYPFLYAWQGFLWEDQGQHEKAQGAFQQAINIAHPRQDRRSLYSGWVGLGIVYQRTGELVNSLQAWEQAVNYAEMGGVPAEKATAFNGLALIHLYSGQNPQALEIHRRCLHLAVNLGKTMHALVLQNIGTVLTYMGEFNEALNWYEESLKLREEANSKPGIANSLNNIGRIQVLTGELESANTHIKQAIDIYREVNNPLWYSYALSNLGELAVAQGDFNKADELYQQSIAIKEQQHDSLGLIHTWTYLSELRRLQGDTRGAEFYAKQTLESGKNITGINEQILAQTALALAWLNEGEIHAAVNLLAEVIDRHQNLTHNHYQLTRCLWYMAHAQTELNQDGRKPLADALVLAERWDYNFLIITLAHELPRILAEAIAYDLQPTFVTKILKRLGDEIVPELSRLIASPDPAISLRAIASLADLASDGVWKPLAQAARIDSSSKMSDKMKGAAEAALTQLQQIPPPPLRVTTLGNFILQVGNRIIKKAEWESNRKSQSVFKFLLLHHDRQVTRDKLIDLLWPETDMEKFDEANQRLNQAIHTLRKVLEPYLPSHFPSRYIISESETYRLDLPLGSWIDDHAVDEAIRNARNAQRLGNNEEMIQQYQAVIDLYHGDYLVDESNQDWPLARQEQLRQQEIEALEIMATYSLDHLDPTRAIELANRILHTEPEHEPGYWLLMQAQYNLGQLVAALRTHKRYIKDCCKELDIPSAKEIDALHQQIRKELRKSS